LQISVDNHYAPTAFRATIIGISDVGIITILSENKQQVKNAPC
jgi:hypothetical protein